MKVHQEGRKVIVESGGTGCSLYCRRISISNNTIPDYTQALYNQEITWGTHEVLELCECKPNEAPNDVESRLFAVKLGSNGANVRLTVRSERRKVGLFKRRDGYWVEPGLSFKIGGSHIWLQSNDSNRYYIGETVSLPFMFESGDPGRTIRYEVAYDKYLTALLEGAEENA